MEESSPNVLSNVKALRPFMHLGMGSPVGVVWVMVLYFGETLHTRDWRDDLLFWASGRIRIATFIPSSVVPEEQSFLSEAHMMIQRFFGIDDSKIVRSGVVSACTLNR